MPRAVPFLLAVALLAVTVGSRVAAQEATPTTDAAALPAPFDELIAAWNGHDPQRLAALYADETVVEWKTAGGPTFRDPDEVAGWAAGTFAAVPDLRFETGAAFVAGDLGGVEWVLIGTYEGQLPGLPPGAGQALSLPGASVFEFRDGKIVRETLYFDLYSLLIQTGAVPPPGAAATPAASAP